MRLSLLSVSAISLLFPGPLSAQLSTSPASLDFGDRGHNETPVAKLTVANSADTPITLRELKPSCSCIKVTAPAQSIPPGGAVDLQVSMGSGRALGSLDKHIEIVASESSVRPLRVPVRMSVFNGLVQEPRDLKFEGVVGGPPVTMSIELHWGPPIRGPVALEVTEPVVLDAARSGVQARPSPHFSTRVVSEGMIRRVEVTLLPSHPEGRVWANLEAKVNGKLLVTPLSGEMFRHIKVSPTYFNFNRVARDDPESFFEESVLTSTDATQFKIVSITPQLNSKESTGWKVHFEPVGAKDDQPALRHVIRGRIEIQEKLPPGTSFSGKATVRTDHPHKPEITLPFFGFFAESKK